MSKTRRWLRLNVNHTAKRAGLTGALAGQENHNGRDNRAA
jgi:hypothetical protein